MQALQFMSTRAREVAAMKAGGGGAVIAVDVSSTLMVTLGEKGNIIKDMQGNVASIVLAVF